MMPEWVMAPNSSSRPGEALRARPPPSATPCFVRGMKARSELKVLIGNARSGRFLRPMSGLIHGPCLFG